jgi:hypothetical protein
MLKKLTIAAVLAAAVLTSGIRPAEAKLVEVWASGLVGAAYGNGKTDRDFFNWAGGGAGGVEVGARILFFSAYIDYLRFFGGDAGANLASFNLGGDGGHWVDRASQARISARRNLLSWFARWRRPTQ